MPTSAGPNSKGENSLVFAIDMADNKNSYIGAPTINRLHQRTGLKGFDLTVDQTWATGTSDHITYDSSVVTPYGNTGATKIEAIEGINNYSLFSLNGWSEGSEPGYTIQALVKPIKLSNWIVFGLYNDGNNRIAFDLNNNSIEYGSGIQNQTAKIKYIKDGWYYLEGNVEGRNGGWVPSLGIANEGRRPISWTPAETQSAYFAAVQIEASRSFATPFVEQERLSTEALLDLTGNNIIDLTNVSFKSNGEITFDGTDDYIQIPYNSTTEVITVEQVLKSPMTSRTCSFGLIENITGTSYVCFDWWIDPSDTIRFYTYDGSGYCDQGVQNSSIVSQHANKYFHLVVSKQGSLLKVFVNGKLIHSNSTWTNGGPPLPLTAEFARIGTRSASGNASQSWQGEIPITKVYNKALSAEEVSANFEVIRKRFNI